LSTEAVQIERSGSTITVHGLTEQPMRFSLISEDAASTALDRAISAALHELNRAAAAEQLRQ
jgi:hypothetical protein